MATARERLIDIDTTPYYHCMSRCVRRAFLCGDDNYTGENFDHRKPWLVDRLKELTENFAIQIVAYSVMSNHYHVILRVDKDQTLNWTEKEVVRRWGNIFPGSIAARAQDPDPLNPVQMHAINEQVGKWRQRLMDISWFMRCLNEHIARMANEEDNCKGRFFEGRFKSRALLDESALLTCMAYVDLNPIHAGLAETLENSDFTSVQERLMVRAKEIHAKKTSRKIKASPQRRSKRPRPGTQLMAFLAPTLKQRQHEVDEERIPMTFDDYIDLVHWTGRALRDDKRGKIPDELQPILERLNINQEYWLDTVEHFETRFYSAAGTINQLRRWSENFGKRWSKAQRCAQAVYG